ncbi:hypothetical protein Tco_1313240 [Tanacetum coccineum]
MHSSSDPTTQKNQYIPVTPGKRQLQPPTMATMEKGVTIQTSAQAPGKKTKDNLVFLHISAYGSYGSSEYDTTQYNDDMVKFIKMALGTQDYASGEYSRPTSEYGLNISGSSSGL